MIAIQLQATTANDAGEEATANIAEALQRLGSECTRIFAARVYPELISMLEAEAKAQFAGQGIGKTGAWEALSQQYAEWKEHHFPGQPINVRTGAMYEGLTDSSSPYALRSAFVDLEYGVAGLPEKYAGFAQFGTVKMPARPPIDLTEDFEQRIIDTTEAVLIGAARDAGVDRYFAITGEQTMEWR